MDIPGALERELLTGIRKWLGSLGDHGTNERAPLREREQVPVGGAVRDELRDSGAA
jgi:hypothetical protein